MSTHKIGFYVEVAKIIFQISSNTHFICFSDEHVLMGELTKIWSYNTYTKYPSYILMLMIDTVQ